MDPARIAGCDGPDGPDCLWTEPAPFASGASHLPQKSELGGFSALHFTQRFASALPHFAQKLFVEGLFVPHFVQRMKFPVDRGASFLCITQRRPGTSRLRKDDRSRYFETIAPAGSIARRFTAQFVTAFKSNTANVTVVGFSILSSCS